MDVKTRKAYDSRIGEKSWSALAMNLKHIIKDPAELKEHLGCSIQAINQYKLGVNFPKMENLIKIAQFYDVSLDWLVGLSKNPSINTDAKFLTDIIGFSPAAVSRLKAFVEGRPKRVAALSILLEQDDFAYILDDVLHCTEFWQWHTPLEEFFEKHEIQPNSYETQEIKEDRLKHKNATSYDAQFKLGKICESLITESEKGAENNGVSSFETK